ncbi:MAG: S8 family serine peptidase, partial [Chitinophagales bacterium]
VKFLNPVVEIKKPFQTIRESAHGTAVASIALAKNNGKGITGIAPNAQFMPVRADSQSDETLIKGFEYAIDNGANIIVSSIGYMLNGGVLSNTMKEALQRLGEKAIFVFAAGNDSKTTFGYANHSNVIGVGACSIYNQLNTYSNTGEHIEIVAPSNGAGLSVIAADLTGEKGHAPGLIDFNFGGTSAAAPMIGGIVALMLSVNPDLGVQEVKSILKETGDKIDGKHFKANAYEAVKRASELSGGTSPTPLTDGDSGTFPIVSTNDGSDFEDFVTFVNELNLRYFKAHEFWVKGSRHNNPQSRAYRLNTNPPREKWENLAKVAKVLDELRHRIGSPITISSAYRSPAYNATIGGASRSQHVEFAALDFTVRGGGSPQDWARILQEMRTEDLFHGGIGIYPSFVHVDIRGYDSDWNG